MSLVSKSSEKKTVEVDSNILNAILSEIKDLRENVDKKASNKAKKKQKETVREEMRPDKVHIFPYNEGDDYVHIALIEKDNGQTAPVIRIEYEKMLQLAKEISSLNPKQKVRISDYEMTEDAAINFDGELVLSQS